MATLGPASLAPEVLRRLIEVGVDAIRINASHASPEDVGPLTERVREAARAAGNDIAVMLDLQGPKMRIGELSEPMELVAGHEVVFRAKGGKGAIPAPMSLIRPYLKRDSDIFLHDGFLRVRVTAIRRDEIVGRVLLGGKLKSRAGLNLPGAPMKTRIPTARDIDHMRAGIAAGIDLFGLSFVRSEADLRRCRVHAGGIPIVAKIERPEAVRAIDAIARASDGILVARGDLAVEMKPEELPVLQKALVAAANRARKPVIVATELLASMVHAPRPTRAELTDVGNAVLDGADAMLLTDETAIGDHPVRAVQFMARIFTSVEASLLQYDIHVRQPHGSAAARPDWALADAAVETAFEIDAKAIVAVTGSGRTARLISARRPSVPVFAFTPDVSVRRRVALMWGVLAHPVEPIPDPDLLLEDILAHLRKEGHLRTGDRAVVVFGAPLWGEGTVTNSLRVVTA